MRTITKKRAKEICSLWHDGQYSALYQFASSGIYARENALHYLREIQDSLHPEYLLFQRILTMKEYRELISLQNYFHKIGLRVKYGKHPVYGYNIPYLEQDENNEGVKCLRYAI